MEQNPFPDKRKKGDKHRNQNRNQKEPGNHDGTQPRFLKKGNEQIRRETTTRTRAGTRSNQQIMMEQNPFPEKRKKREEGRQAPEPEPEPGNRTPFPEKRKKKEEGRQAPAPVPEPPGTKKSWRNRTPFRRKEKREEGKLAQLCNPTAKEQFVIGNV